MDVSRNKIGLDTVVYKVGTISTVEMDGELGMMSVEHGKYYSLDSVGTYIWNIISTPKSITTIIGELLEIYDVEEETCVKNVLDFLEQMHAENLIEYKV